MCLRAIAAGSGAVVIETPSCVGCVLLGTDPFVSPRDVPSDVGVFASSLVITAPPLSPSPPPPVSGVTDDGALQALASAQVLALENLFFQLGDGDASGVGGEEGEDEQLCR